MAQCRAHYEQAIRSRTTAADKPAIPLAKAAPEKSEAEKAADPLHGKSWTEFAADCRAYYLNNSDQPAGSAGQRAKVAPKPKPSGG